MEAKQTELRKNSKWSKIPNALTISRLVIAVAIVLVLLIRPYGWDIDNDGTLGIAVIPFLGITCEINGTLFQFEGLLYTQVLVAGGLFVLGCLTDFLDGYLSRKYNWISNFGKIMDPVADKVLVDATLIVLSVYNLVFVWITIIIIARDILVDATRMVKAKEGIVVPANVWGKCKTIFQMLGIMLILFCFNRYMLIPDTGIPMCQDHAGPYLMYNPIAALANTGLYLALIFSVVSGVIYEVKMLSKPKVK